MELNEKIFDDYFSGRMSEGEIKSFNSKLNEDKEFYNDYQFFLSIKKSAAKIERKKMREQLNNIKIASVETNKPSNEKQNNKSVNTDKSKPKVKSLKWILIILSLLLLTYFSYNYFSSDSPEAIYASNFETYQAQSTRGENKEQIKLLYEEGKYTEFIEQLKEVNNNPELNMMLAHAHIHIGGLKLAEKHLLNISDDSSLRDQKYWYLGLVSLKMNHVPQAKNHFVYLQKVSNYKKKEIEKILSRLN